EKNICYHLSEKIFKMLVLVFMYTGYIAFEVGRAWGDYSYFLAAPLGKYLFRFNGALYLMPIKELVLQLAVVFLKGNIQSGIERYVQRVYVGLCLELLSGRTIWVTFVFANNFIRILMVFCALVAIDMVFVGLGASVAFVHAFLRDKAPLKFFQEGMGLHHIHFRSNIDQNIKGVVFIFWSIIRDIDVARVSKFLSIKIITIKFILDTTKTKYMICDLDITTHKQEDCLERIPFGI
ncbi:hypothetical protein ACJX0J_016878, partial [Zea mays]